MAMLACGLFAARMAMRQVADALAGSGGTFSSDNDPETGARGDSVWA